MFQKLLEVLFPRTCPICGTVLKTKESRICKDCKGKATLITAPTCKRCGKAIARMEDEYCFDCAKRKQVHFEKGFAVWEYNECMKESIALFKYNGRRENGEYFVEEVLYHYGSQLRELELSVVIPVPLHKEKQRFRGFNQAEVLAEGIGNGLSVPVVSDLLKRRKNTKPQKGLDDQQRYDNLKHAFVVENVERARQYERVLLVDDIYTTGATIDKCAAKLKEAGVKEVYFICLCIGKDF